MTGSSPRNFMMPGWKMLSIFACLLSQLFAILIVHIAVQKSIACQEQDNPGLSLSGGAPSPSMAELNPNCQHEATDNVLLSEVAAAFSSLKESLSNPDVAESKAASAPLDPSVPRLVDEPHKPHPASNIPGVEDIHKELKEYAARISGTWTAELQDAARRQSRPSAADLGLRAVDPMDETDSIPHRLAFLNELALETAAAAPARVAIATTSAADLAGVRKELLPWLQYHTELGVSKFFILYDGSDAAAVEALSAVHHVHLLHIHAPWAAAPEAALWEAHANFTEHEFGAKNGNSDALGNYDLMAKQGHCLQEALSLAKEAGFDWLMHLDPDELFLPGGGETSVAAELSRAPADAPAVRFMNFEAQPEFGDVSNRFEQVTLFRTHKHFITPEALHYRGKFKLGLNQAFLYLYANGKSAVRLNAPGARPAGPHYFSGDGGFPGAWWNAVSDSASVLHYAYTSPAEVSAKAHRSCPFNLTAAEGERQQAAVKDACFIIQFDADAYVAAMQGPEAVADFFYTRMVLSEGSPVQCAEPKNGRSGWCALSDIPRFVFLMEKVGLMRRVLLPQVLLRQHERAIRKRARGSNRGVPVLTALDR